MTVYLLHLNQPLSRGTSSKGQVLEAQHYIGFTDDLAGRIKAHIEGRGARFVQVCLERGIDFELARVWGGALATRRFERRLKNYKKPKRFCPICSPGALKCMQLEDS